MTCAIGNGILNVPGLDHVDNDELFDLVNDAREELEDAHAFDRQSFRHLSAWDDFQVLLRELERRGMMGLILVH